MQNDSVISWPVELMVLAGVFKHSRWYSTSGRAVVDCKGESLLRSTCRLGAHRSVKYQLITRLRKWQLSSLLRSSRIIAVDREQTYTWTLRCHILFLLLWREKLRFDSVTVQCHKSACRALPCCTIITQYRYAKLWSSK